MFLTEKRDGTVKGRMVYNDKPTREAMGIPGGQRESDCLSRIFIFNLNY